MASRIAGLLILAAWFVATAYLAVVTYWVIGSTQPGSVSLFALGLTVAVPAWIFLSGKILRLARRLLRAGKEHTR